MMSEEIQATKNDQTGKQSILRGGSPDSIYDETSEMDWLDHDDEIDVYDDMEGEVDPANEGDYPSSSEESQSSTTSDASDTEDSEDRDAADDSVEPASRQSVLQRTMAQFPKAETTRIPSPSDAAMVKPTRSDSFDDTNEPAVPHDSSGSGRFMPSAMSTFLPPASNAQQQTGRYTQGPFMMPYQATQPYPPPQRLNHPYMIPFESYPPIGAMPYFGGDQLVDMELDMGPSQTHGTSTLPQQPPRFWREPEGAPYSHTQASTSQSHNPLPYDRPTDRSSRLTISHLVNASHDINDQNIDAAPESPLKRKADRISSDDTDPNSIGSEVSGIATGDNSIAIQRNATPPDFGQAYATKEDAAESPAVDTQEPSLPSKIHGAELKQVEQMEKMLHDAQFCEFLPPVEDVSQFYTQCVPKFKPAAQDVIAETKARGEPAPKRTKTEHRTGGSWIRKTATHMLAGVAGAASLLAVLIATVPEGTQMEASAEY